MGVAATEIQLQAEFMKEKKNNLRTNIKVSRIWHGVKNKGTIDKRLRRGKGEMTNSQSLNMRREKENGSEAILNEDLRISQS